MGGDAYAGGMMSETDRRYRRMDFMMKALWVEVALIWVLSFVFSGLIWVLSFQLIAASW